jgi:uncharacterized membrane protein YgcG
MFRPSQSRGIPLVLAILGAVASSLVEATPLPTSISKPNPADTPSYLSLRQAVSSPQGPRNNDNITVSADISTAASTAATSLSNINLIALIVVGGVVVVTIWFLTWWRGAYKINGSYTPTPGDMVACWNQYGYNHIMFFDWRGRLKGWQRYNGNPDSIPHGWELGGPTAGHRKMRALWDRYGRRHAWSNSYNNNNGGGDSGGGGSGGDSGGGCGGDGGGGGSGGDGGG